MATEQIIWRGRRSAQRRARGAWRTVLMAWCVEALFRGDIDRAEYLDKLRAQLEAS